jgi:hypothetical protein
MDPIMASGSSKLGLWAYYYRYFSVVTSSVLFVSLVNNGYGKWMVLPALAWMAYSIYWRWPEKKIEGVGNYKAIIVGAGFSGLDMALNLQKAGIPYVILEKSDNLGGTWHDNRYPGAACDIMSHLYRYILVQSFLRRFNDGRYLAVFQICLIHGGPRSIADTVRSTSTFRTLLFTMASTTTSGLAKG